MRWILALSLIFGGVLAGCSSDHEVRGEGAPMSGAGEAMDQKYSQYDPVCNMNVNPRSAGWKESYGGKTWYFDSEECWRKFKDNPSAFVPATDRDRSEREVR